MRKIEYKETIASFDCILYTRTDLNNVAFGIKSFPNDCFCTFRSGYMTRHKIQNGNDNWFEYQCEAFNVLDRSGEFLRMHSHSEWCKLILRLGISIIFRKNSLPFNPTYLKVSCNVLNKILSRESWYDISRGA